MGRAVLAVGQRGALAGLALAGGRLAAGHALAVPLDLLEDVGDGGTDVTVDRVVGPWRVGGREEVPNLVEQAMWRLREVVGIASQPLDRRRRGLQHAGLAIRYGNRFRVRNDEILDFDE